MNPRNWIWLLSWLVIRIPTVIKQYQHSLRVVAFQDGKVFPNIFDKLSSVVKERLNVKESSEFREPNLFGPAYLSVDGIDIKAIPHLYFIDSISRGIVNTSCPIKLVVPIPSLLFSPSALSDQDKTNYYQKTRYPAHRFEKDYIFTQIQRVYLIKCLKAITINKIERITIKSILFFVVV